MDEPLIPSPPTAQEIVPPPLLPFWRKDADYFRVIPCCRTCAMENNLKKLVPFAENYPCQVSKCENFAAYLSVQ